VEKDNQVNAGQYILIFGVRLYRWVLSPAKIFLFGPLGRCRFTPTCSEYALEAIRTHGTLDGSWLALKRIVRCHPWGDCGPDPVPPVGRGSDRFQVVTGLTADVPCQRH